MEECGHCMLPNRCFQAEELSLYTFHSGDCVCVAAELIFFSPKDIINNYSFTAVSENSQLLTGAPRKFIQVLTRLRLN